MCHFLLSSFLLSVHFIFVFHFIPLIRIIIFYFCPMSLHHPLFQLSLLFSDFQLTSSDRLQQTFFTNPSWVALNASESVLCTSKVQVKGPGQLQRLASLLESQSRVDPFLARVESKACCPVTQGQRGGRGGWGVKKRKNEISIN